MPRITVAEAQAWVEGTKFTIAGPFAGTNLELLLQIEEEVVARVAAAYPVEYLTWTTDANTPRLVRVAIAKLFVAWMYRRQYSEDLGEEDAAYAAKLEANSQSIIDGINDGTIDVPGVTSSIGPVFYPTDASSAMEPTPADRSLGPEVFSMGMRF